MNKKMLADLDHGFYIRIDNVDVYVCFRELDGADVYGEYRPEKMEIVLNPTATLEMRRRTLVHEVCHAILDIRGRRALAAAKEVEDQDTWEDAVIEQTGEAFAAVLLEDQNLRFALGLERIGGEDGQCEYQTSDPAGE